MKRREHDEKRQMKETKLKVTKDKNDEILTKKKEVRLADYPHA